MDFLLENKFQRNDNMKDCNRKICKNYLTICHLSVPNKLKDERAAAAVHRELTKERSRELKHVEVQPHACSRCKLAAHVVTSDQTNADNLKIHMKQH